MNTKNPIYFFILHGPNLNLLGTREPDIYGTMTLQSIQNKIDSYLDHFAIASRYQQSNHEGELIDFLHDASHWASGVVFNPGAYTHTSIALRDAVSAIAVPVVEVHLSNIHAREPFRRISMISPVCQGTISGFGWQSYLLGVQSLVYQLDLDG